MAQPKEPPCAKPMVPPISHVTPARPIIRPLARVASRRSPSHSQPEAATNRGAIASKMADRPAGRLCAAYENSTNGSAEFASPIKLMERQWVRSSVKRSREASKGSEQRAAPIARIPANAMLPN